MHKFLIFALCLTALISTQTGCAWFAKQEASVSSENTLQAYKILLINESDTTLKYRYKKFTYQTENGYSQRELNPRNNSMSLSMTLGWTELETGDQVQLNVLANSDLVLEYAQGDTVQKKTIRIQKNQEVRLDNHGLRQKNWTPAF